MSTSELLERLAALEKKLTCQVCGLRKGRVVEDVHYRLEGEEWDAWKKSRALIVCRFCANKTRANGWMHNKQIFVHDYIPEKEEP